MDKIKQKLKKRLLEDRKMTDTLNKLLQRQPEGRLQVSTMRGHPRYYQYLRGQRRYLGKAEAGLVKKLAEKEYCEGMLEKAQKETRLLEYFLEGFEPTGFVNYYEELNEGRKRMVDPIILPDNLFAEQWLTRMRTLTEVQSNDYEKPEEFTTLNGEKVRSKSEKILADLLKHYGIIYVYEAPLTLKDGVVYPDFTILNLRTREVWYWEHLGKMDDADYAAKNARKVRRYEAAGIFPGEHLIITMETSQHPLRTDEIKMFIERYLL